MAFPEVYPGCVIVSVTDVSIGFPSPNVPTKKAMALKPRG